MSMIVTGIDMPRSCGACEASGTGVCKLWMKSSEINGIGYNRHSDCPLKSVEGLIEEINNIDPWNTEEKAMKYAITELIKKYCEEGVVG